MVSSGEAASQAFQDFKGEDSEPLQQMPVQICSETGLKCIFWKDVKNTFQGSTLYVLSMRQTPI
ncbi:hypothetical protein BG003_004666 [Podila horticola]|nr:hypothetical protein BG003_004666 [Podila horticola]